MAYGDPEIKLLGATPHLSFTPEVYYSLRRLFSKSTEERMAWLHGELDNESLTGLVTDISIPPQFSGPGSCEPDNKAEEFMDYSDEFFERCKTNPVIGRVHSFSGGGHHSARDDSTDSLEAERSFDRGNRLYFSVTMSSGSKPNPDTQVEAVITLGGDVQVTVQKCAFGMDVPRYDMFSRVDAAEDFIRSKPTPPTKKGGPAEGVGKGKASGGQTKLTGPSSASDDKSKVIIPYDDGDVDEFFDGEYYNSDHVYNPQKKVVATVTTHDSPQKSSSKASSSGAGEKASKSPTQKRKKKPGRSSSTKKTSGKGSSKK